MTASTHTDTLLGDRTTGLAGHLAVNGPIPWRGGPGKLIADLATAGLTGRGGASFPAWRKASTALGGRSPVVVANGAEGEPLSHKDATLLRGNPHRASGPGPRRCPEWTAGRRCRTTSRRWRTWP